MPESKTVLIVDDEDAIRAIARITLENRGYRVMQAENGRQGIEELKKSRPDMIVLDLMMPEMNGIEFCNKMIDRLNMADVPVMVLSAVNEKAGVVRQFLQLPLKTKQFVTKPIEPEDLLRRVEETIGEAKSRDGRPTATRSAKAESPSRSTVSRRASRPTALPQATPAPPAPEPAEPPRKAASPKPAAPPRPSATESPNRKAAGPRFRVLVIDDEEDIRILLKTALGLKFEVEAAENGMDALTIIDRVDPDFVITDINMPTMNGLETVEAIRRHPKFGRTPVFFLTGEKDKALPRKSFDVGGNLYLRKPIDPARLLKLIDYFIEEAELEPRPREAPKSGSIMDAIVRPERGRPGVPVRVLTIDYSVEDTAKLRRWLGEMGEKKVETLWADDARGALGNLSRWEPDVILYNPRNPGLDGIAFGQTLRIKNLAERFQIAFVGTKFHPADLEYAARIFGREAIALDGPEPVALAAVAEAIETARSRLTPKQKTIEEIREEDARHQAEVRSARNMVNAQREFFRNRFGKIQEYIDGIHAE
jgi:CheY-like chemotaxis protein